MNSASQKGFALTDAIIAAVISAGVAAAAAQSISVAVRAVSKSQKLDAVISEAEIIASRIDAGLTEEDLLEGLEGWSVARLPFVIGDVEGHSSASAFVRLTVSHVNDPAFTFDRIIVGGDTP